MMHTDLAYIYPGTGSLLLSFILGSTIGAGVFLRRTLFRLVQWVAGPRDQAVTAPPEPAGGEHETP